MSDKAPIRDFIGKGELKVFYTGDVNDEIDKRVVDALSQVGYEFKGMSHMYDFIHRMSFESVA